MSKFTLAIHGGAGTILKADMTHELEKAYIEGLQLALDAGFAVLEEEGSAVNAVKAVLVILEDNMLFNAGRGSVFTKKGVQEMDAAIMDGSNLEAGSVAAVRNVRNPIELAAEVMRNSNHVFLSGKGANDFAIKQGIKLEPDEYFFSQFRYDQWKDIRDSDNYSLDHTHQRLEEIRPEGPLVRLAHLIKLRAEALDVARNLGRKHLPGQGRLHNLVPLRVPPRPPDLCPLGVDRGRRSRLHRYRRCRRLLLSHRRRVLEHHLEHCLIRRGRLRRPGHHHRQ